MKARQDHATVTVTRHAYTELRSAVHAGVYASSDVWWAMVSRFMGINMSDSPSLQIVNEQCFNHFIRAYLYLSLRATLLSQEVVLLHSCPVSHDETVTGFEVGGTWSRGLGTAISSSDAGPCGPGSSSVDR